jgi:hypothetical protein
MDYKYVEYDGNYNMTTGDISKTKGAIHKIGTKHMVDNNHLYEPQRNNNFEVQIHFDGILGPDGIPLLTKHNKAGQDILLSVDSFDAPNISIDVITVPYGNNEVKYAGKPSYSTSSISINDFIGLDVERILSDWHDCVYDPKTQKIGRAINYKASAHLVEYSPDGELYRMWMLHGVWPSDFNLGSFEQQGGSVRQIQLTLVYDYATIDTENRVVGNTNNRKRT